MMLITARCGCCEIIYAGRYIKNLWSNLLCEKETSYLGLLSANLEVDASRVKNLLETDACFLVGAFFIILGVFS